MLKKIFLMSAVALVNISASAQEHSLTSIGKVSANLSSISLDYQTPISNNLLLDSKVKIGAGTKLTSESLGLDYAHPALGMSSEVRYLYSYEKRVAQDRNTRLNTAPYVALKANYQLSSFNNKENETFGNTLSFAGVWGIQANFSEDFLFNFHAGLGWANDFHTKYTTLYPEVGIGCSYVFMNRSKSKK